MSAPAATAQAAPVLVLAAHPDLAHSRVHRHLLARLAGQPGVAVLDLYALYPDYHLDVPAEQAALAPARLVVWLHPVHWYGPTPLLKLWQDEVLAFGWAYGPGGNALRGKDLWLVASTGGSAHSYSAAGHNRHDMAAFWPPYAQTAALMGMRFLPPLVLHGAHQATPEAIEAHAQQVLERLARWPHWPGLAAPGDCPECRTPSDERPLS